MIGNGVVIDPGVLLEEMDGLSARGVDVSRIVISADAHLIMPYHVAIDKVAERYLGKAKIGTTGRGIGPAYQDKVARLGVRTQDLFDESILRQKVESALDLKNQILTKIYNRKALDPHAVVDELLVHGERIKPMITDTRVLLRDALDRGDNVLLEGSQGTLLDVDHGTYPFVTSSNPTGGGAAVGSGIGPTRITRVIGILKAYTTRVGSGPFPTELFDEYGEMLRKVGGEVGVNTGRDRRCGWFDAVIARYATMVNGLTDIFLTKLDILSGLDKVPVCVAYDVDGERVTRCRPRRPVSTTPSRCTSTWMAGGRTSPALVRWPTCRPTRGSTWSGWRSCPARRSALSASVPAARRTSSYEICSTDSLAFPLTC